MKQYTVKATKMAYAGNCNSIEELVEMPERYSLVDEEPWRTEGMKKIIVKNFLIYFWIVRAPGRSGRIVRAVLPCGVPPERSKPVDGAH